MDAIPVTHETHKMSRDKVKMTGRHVAAARELLRLTREDLAAIAEVGESTIYRFEQDLRDIRGATREKIRHALESRGIEFLNHGAIGVRLHPVPQAKSP